MKTYRNLYQNIISIENLFIALKRARKGKTKKTYVLEFEQNLQRNILELHEELKNETYQPESLKTFILRDPKTRKISKSAFRDRIVHHAIVNVLEPIFDKTFISDSCANRKGKGNLYALRRFDEFKRKVSGNGNLASGRFDSNYVKGYCLKADIRHYFDTVNHNLLLDILIKKIDDEHAINLIRKVLNNFDSKIAGKGMPLGNLTSQFFANVYLNELDYFVKHELKAKYYIRYVDDFALLHESKEQLGIWKERINIFLRDKLELELHPDKSKVIPLSKGVDFVGFRNLYHFRLLRRRNIGNMERKVFLFKQDMTSKETLVESFKGWKAYARWSNSFKLCKRISNKIE